jgi:hypothetical protein
MFSTSHAEETPQKPSCSINVSGSVCVTVCGLSAGCLRQVSIAADVLFIPKKASSIFLRYEKPADSSTLK